jgi:hypothetical protein
MSHPMQHFLKTNATHAPAHTGNEDPLGQADTLKIVSCPVCRAVYIPSWRQEREQASLAMLESAFVSICHFCFRCQRPACPQCWNPIHCACASCSEEAQLPFRSPVPSLEGLIFSCPGGTSSEQSAPRSFTCLRNGSFYCPEPGRQAKDLQKDRQSEQPSSPVTSADLPVLQGHAVSPASFDPPWLREMLEQRREERIGEPVSHPTGQWGKEVARSVHALSVSPHTSGPEWAAAPQLLPALPVPSTEVREVTTQEQENEREEEDEGLSLFERVENVLIIVLSTILLAIILMLILALSFPQMNAFFSQLIHIDIRTEILYLLQLR